jgi:hypothetical protein
VGVCVAVLVGDGGDVRRRLRFCGHGIALAREIPGAELLLLDGIGHQAPPPSTWDRAVPAMLRLTAP